MGLGFRVQGSEFRVQGSGFRVRWRDLPMCMLKKGVEGKNLEQDHALHVVACAIKNPKPNPKP